MTQEAELKALIEEYIATEHPEIYIVQIVVGKGGHARVQVEQDGGIGLGVCAEIMKGLRPFLEAKLPWTERMGLEVGSPGVGEPLRLERQYRNNVGRQLEAHTSDGEQIVGKLIAVADGAITLQTAKKDKKTRKTVVAERALPLAEIKKAVVQVQF